MPLRTYLTPTENAFNVNHDTLMTLSPLNQRKLITFFIGANTPKKLDPEDRLKLHNSIKSVRNKNFFASLFGGAAAFGLFASAKRSVVSSVAAAFATVIAVRIIHMDWFEKNLIFNDPLIATLAEKYDFSVFDFHNSKREAILLGLINSIESESKSGWNMSVVYE